MDRREIMLKSCKYYLDHWINILPVNKEKKPLISWKHLQEKMATMEDVESWLDSFPDMELGWVTWLISNIIVVDIEKWWDTSWLPKTAIVSTWGGWFHYYYSYVKGMTNKVRIKELTDIRSDWWYVVLPPSMSFKWPYKWVSKVKLAPFPLTLFEETSVVEPSEILLNWYSWYGKGNRNNEMTKYAWFVLAKTHPSIWDTEWWDMFERANERNSPPLSQNELRAIFDSIKNLERRNGSTRWYKKEEPVKQSEMWKEEENKILSLQEIAKKEAWEENERYSTWYQMIDSVTDWWFKDGDLIIISGQSGFWKCHGKWTEVMMFDGSIKKVEDVLIWDKLMGVDSKERNVLSLARGSEEMYAVVDIKGNELYTVNKSHILSLRKSNTWEILNIPVEEYLKKSWYFKNLYKGYRVSLEFDEKDLEIDPYFLGVWLGDWTSTKPSITTSDNEIVDYLYNYSESLGLDIHINVQKNNKSDVYHIIRERSKADKGSKYKTSLNWKNHLLDSMRNLWLINNKHIPDVYKFNSRENRLKLLAGILDTDWYMIKNCFWITQKSERLARDIVWLAKSLWFSTSLRKVTKTIKSTWFSWEYWYTWINWETSEIPVIVKRRKCKKRTNIRNILNYWFELVPIGVWDYYWFELDWDHLYVLWDFSVTHNTSLALSLSVNMALQWLPVLFFSYEVLMSHLWNKFKEMNATDDLPIYSVEKHTTGNVGWIQEKLKEAIKTFGIKVLVIDHLWFLIPKHKLEASWNYANYVAQIVRELKTIAKEERIILILPVHVRKTDDPGMNDLKDSSAISQESDMVIMLNRERDYSNSSEQYYTNYVNIYSVKNRSTGQNFKGWFTMEEGKFIHAPYYTPQDKPWSKLKRF